MRGSITAERDAGSVTQARRSSEDKIPLLYDHSPCTRQLEVGRRIVALALRIREICRV